MAKLRLKPFGEVLDKPAIFSLYKTMIWASKSMNQISVQC